MYTDILRYVQGNELEIQKKSKHVKTLCVCTENLLKAEKKAIQKSIIA